MFEMFEVFQESGWVFVLDCVEEHGLPLCSCVDPGRSLGSSTYHKVQEMPLP